MASQSLPAELGGLNESFCTVFRIFSVYVPVMCYIWHMPSGTYTFCNITSYWHNDITNDVIMCTHSWSRNLLDIKGAVHQGGEFCSQDLLGFGPFEVCTGSDASRAPLWSEPIIFKCKGCLSCVLSAMCVLTHVSTLSQ